MKENSGATLMRSCCLTEMEKYFVRNNAAALYNSIADLSGRL